MAGKTPRQAADNFIAPIQRALACITADQIHISGYEPGQTHAWALNGGNPATVKTQDGEDRFQVGVVQHFRVVESANERGPWKVATTKYVYALYDATGVEIFSYHWHPGIGPTYPHLHVKATVRNDVKKAHFPTARISLEQFIRVLLVDFHLRRRRASWKKILDETQRAFERWRTWP